METTPLASTKLRVQWGTWECTTDPVALATVIVAAALAAFTTGRILAVAGMVLALAAFWKVGVMLVAIQSEALRPTNPLHAVVAEDSSAGEVDVTGEPAAAAAVVAMQIDSLGPTNPLQAFGGGGAVVAEESSPREVLVTGEPVAAATVVEDASKGQHATPSDSVVAIAVAEDTLAEQVAEKMTDQAEDASSEESSTPSEPVAAQTVTEDASAEQIARTMHRVEDASGEESATTSGPVAIDVATEDTLAEQISKKMTKQAGSPALDAMGEENPPPSEPVVADTVNQERVVADPDHIELLLERMEREDWGFAWQVSAHKVQRLIIAGISIASPAGLWNAARHGQGSPMMQVGDELLSIDGATSVSILQSALDSTTSVNLRFLRVHAVLPVPAALSALARPRLKGPSQDGESKGVMKNVVFDVPTWQKDSFVSVVKNTFIEVSLPEVERVGGQFAQSDPGPMMRLIGQDGRTSPDVQSSLGSRLETPQLPCTESSQLSFLMDTTASHDAVGLSELAAVMEAVRFELGRLVETNAHDSQWIEPHTDAANWADASIEDSSTAHHGIPENTAGSENSTVGSIGLLLEQLEAENMPQKNTSIHYAIPSDDVERSSTPVNTAPSVMLSRLFKTKARVRPHSDDAACDSQRVSVSTKGFTLSDNVAMDKDEVEGGFELAMSEASTSGFDAASPLEAEAVVAAPIGYMPNPAAIEAHTLGKCTPCNYFLYKQEGCRFGSECTFCHVCPKGEIKKRRKAKLKEYSNYRKLSTAEVALGLTDLLTGWLTC